MSMCESPSTDNSDMMSIINNPFMGYLNLMLMITLQVLNVRNDYGKQCDYLAARMKASKRQKLFFRCVITYRVLFNDLE